MKRQSGYWKGFASALVLVAMVAALGVTAGAASDRYSIEVRDGVKLIINGAKFTPTNVHDEEVPVFTYDGTTYAPVRAVCEAAGMDVDFDAKTRTVVLTTPDWDLKDDPKADEYISADRAREIARKDAGLRKNEMVFLKVRLDMDRDETAHYDVEFYSKGVEYDYEIDALTGEILDCDHDVDKFDAPDWDEDDDDDDDLPPGQTIVIKEKKARQIALKKAPKGTVVESCEMDEDDGRVVYELELRHGDTEYECEIDAETGEVLHWESGTDD